MARAMWVAAAVIATIVGQAAAAQSAPAQRKLEVPATAAWGHAATGTVLPFEVAGFSRSELIDLTSDEQDVIATYRDPQTRTITSLYLYRSLLDDASLWFDRTLAAIARQREFAGAAAAGGPLPFARPGGTKTSGLRASFSVPGGGTKSTAVAVAPLGGWLLKVRMTSATLAAAELDQRLTGFLAGLRWPAPPKTERDAVAVVPCPDRLTAKKARVTRPDMAQAMINALGSIATAGVALGESYCREGDQPGGTWAVYRPAGAHDRYVIGLGDAGTAVVVGPSMTMQGVGEKAARPGYAMNLIRYASSSVISSFNRMPPPEQALSVLSTGRSSGMSISVGAPSQ